MVPILDIEVAVVIDRAAVGGGEDAFLPVLGRHLKIGALGYDGIVTKFAEDFVIFVEKQGASGEFRDEDEIVRIEVLQGRRRPVMGISTTFPLRSSS